MSLLIKNKNNKKSSLSLSSTIATTNTTIVATACAPTRTRDLTLHKNSTLNSISTTASLVAPSIVEATSNVDVVSSSSCSSSALSLLSLMKQSTELAQLTSASAIETSSVISGTGRKVLRTMPSFKIMSYQKFIALLTLLVCGFVTVNGLKCYMCGQYNEGVGSITPCLNYSEQYAHLYLKECSKKSEKYCVKYVSELSIVRDCATECAEKEIWETQTYCCTEDGCNGSSTMEVSAIFIMLPLVIYILNEVMNIFKQQRR